MILFINFQMTEQIVFDAREFIYLCSTTVSKWISSGVRLSGLNNNSWMRIFYSCHGRIWKLRKEPPMMMFTTTKQKKNLFFVCGQIPFRLNHFLTEMFFMKKTVHIGLCRFRLRWDHGNYKEFWFDFKWCRFK